jgi:hypothetical protein
MQFSWSLKGVRGKSGGNLEESDKDLGSLMEFLEDLIRI